MWCFIVPCPALMCCAVLMHVTYLVKTTSHASAPPPLTAAIQTRAAYCCRHPAGPATIATLPPLPCPCPCLTNPAFPQISPDFNPNLAELTYQFWSFKGKRKKESRHHLCAVEMRRTIKRGDLGRLIEFTVFPDWPSWEHLSFLCTSIEIPLGSCWWMLLIRLFDRYREIRGSTIEAQFQHLDSVQYEKGK